MPENRESENPAPFTVAAPSFSGRPGQPPERPPPDKGTPRSRLLAWIATVIFFGAVVVLQQPGNPRADDAAAEGIGQVEPDAADAPVEPGDEPLVEEVVEEAAEETDSGLAEGSAQLRITAGMILRIHSIFSQTNAAQPTAPQFHGMITTPADRVRVAIVAGEIDGGDAALEEIEEARAAIETETEPALRDLDVLTAVYTAGPDSVDAAAAAELIDRHGWLARVALVYGLPKESEARQEVFEGSARALWLITGFILLVTAAFMAGLVCFVFAVIGLSKRRSPLRFRPPLAGGSVYLETFALFMAAFLVVKLVAGALAPYLGSAVLGLQWLLLLVALWPMVRGVSWSEHREAIGWTSGSGFFREVACGVFGYLAALPIFALAIVLVLIMMLIRGMVSGEEAAPTSNPILEVVGNGSPLVIALVVALATMWAPLAEESVFRGALFRHFRGRMHWVFAGLLSAVAFAVVHNYGLLLTPPLIALGFAFAAMREWRGSLIAPMTAHLLHNGTIMLVVVLAISITR